MTGFDIDAFAQRKLAALTWRNLQRHLTTVAPRQRTNVTTEGLELVSFAGNDYLGLARDRRTVAAAADAAQQLGAGAGSARLIAGNHPLYAELETALARIKATDAAVVFGSGYLASLGVIPVFAGAADLILIDELAHSCLLAGAKLSGAKTVAFRHNDVDDARRLLKEHRSARRHCLIVTEGVFSMDGDLAPLPALAGIAREYHAWMLTDDAHGLGVVGGGRGSTFAWDERVDIALQLGTLSKAAGAYGGYLCAGDSAIELVCNRAASFVYSTALPPAVVAAAIAGLACIASDPARVARPLEHAARFAAALGLAAPESAIVPIVIGSATDALNAAARLRDAGFFVPAIRPPTVPAGTSRLRFTFSAAHSTDQVDSLARAVAAIGLGR